LIAQDDFVGGKIGYRCGFLLSRGKTCALGFEQIRVRLLGLCWLRSYRILRRSFRLLPRSLFVGVLELLDNANRRKVAGGF